MKGLRAGLLPLAVLGMSWLGGCGPAADVHLIQARLSGYRQHLHLTAQQAGFSPADDVDRVLVEFPRPGASTGRRPFVLLYLRLPAGVAEPAVGPGRADAVRGFFIQTRGEYAGLSTLVGGTIKVGGSGATRRMEFELDGEDGTRLVGKVLAKRDDWKLKDFETERHPGDVANLMAGTVSSKPAS